MTRNPYLKHFLVACVFLVVSATAWAQSRERDYLRQDSSRFRIWYCPEDQGVVPSLWRVFYQRVPLLELQLRLSLSDTVDFIITPTKDEWRRITGGAPLWANGLAEPQHHVAILKSPRFSVQYGPLENTAIHEYVHLLSQTGAREMELPRWLDEGMAEVLAGQLEFMSHTILGRSVASGRLHSLWQIQGLMSMSEPDAQLAYAESAIAVEFLVSKFGWPGVANLIATLRQGTPFDEAFSRIFGLSPGAFESEYLRYVQKTYQLSWLTDTEIWVSLLFILGVFAAGVAAWKRRRKTLRKWDEEHRAETVGETNAPPYTINYEIIRSRKDEGGDSDSSSPSP